MSLDDQDATLDARDDPAPGAPRAARRVMTLRRLFDGAGVPRAGAPVVQVLSEGSFAVGRAAEAEALRIADDRRASRVHAVFHVGRIGALGAGPGGALPVHLVDHSRNGTFVNGAPAKEAALKSGDVVRAGDSFFLLREELEDGGDQPVEGLLGISPPVRALRRSVRLVGPTSATVLLLGESGVGKEVAARALHAHGRGGPFVPVNCAAIPEALAESQLFGHAKGAFTGASAAHDGFFRAAHTGTLFLDEVGELSPALQPKLLRALEERAVQPVGTTAPVPVDVRLIAATNRDLLAEARAGRFRGDLYARLAEVVVQLPPLRERREDILPLLLAFLGPSAPPLSPDLVERLLLYAWPFNVRELSKVATTLSIVGRGAASLELHLVEDRLREMDDEAPAPGVGVEAAGLSASAVRADEGADRAQAPSRAEVEALLRAHKGVVVDVARAAGRSRKQVYRWLERYGLDVEAFRDGPSS